MELPITLGLPVSTMTVVQSNGRYGARLELRVAAADENGNRSDIPVIPLHLTSDKAPTPGNFIRYDTRLKLRETARHLVLALYDPLSGNIATAEADLTKLPGGTN